MSATRLETHIELLKRDGVALAIDYTSSLQYQIDALTQGQIERYIRIEGINTADGNLPVVLEVFRFVSDPLQSKGVITDTGVAQLVLAGSILSDALQTTGSKFFKETLLRT